MNLTLSQRGDYVVRSAIDLARSWPDGYRKVREIAEAMDLPRSFTPRVLGDLVKAGIAVARAGRAGGYRLARAPRDISLLDVVVAAEGPLKMDRCTLRGGPCHWEEVCALHPAWAGASEAMRSFLAGITLADVAAVDQLLAAGSYATPPNAHRKPPTRRAHGAAGRPHSPGPLAKTRSQIGKAAVTVPVRSPRGYPRPERP